MTIEKILAGKTALVTGGNCGIGWSIARPLAERGAAVGISGRNEKTLAALTPGSWWKRCDARREEDQKALFAEAKKE